jgi:glycosyltransferase involved in cell wall biosynthesis
LTRGFAASGLTDTDLVLAGGRPDERDALRNLATELGCVERVRFLGFLPDEELPELYSGALAFVYPSEYEGFGLQVCEAMAVGCPVLVARATSLPEIAGPGGETFDLGSTDELVQLLRRVAFDERHRTELVERARNRSSVFSWVKAAAETASVYRRLTPRVRE